MNDDKIKSITQAAVAEIDVSFPNQEDRNAASMWLTELILILSQPYIASIIHGGVILVPNQLPMGDKKFCEVMRIAANVLEAYGENE